MFISVYHYPLNVLQLVVDGVDVASPVSQLLLGLLDVHVEFDKRVRSCDGVHLAAIVLVELFGNVLQVRERHSL